MNFNITLLPCSTTNCTNERQTAHDQNAVIMNIDTNTTANTSSANQFFGSNNGNSGSNLSVFIGIGTGLTLMGLCTMGVIAGARKFREAPEEEPLQSQDKVEPEP